jgi:restriction endonuclease Mrr
VNGNKLSKLSALQKKILEKTLLAYYRTPLDIDWGSPDPGSFTLKASRGFDAESGRQLPITDHRARAARRAAAGSAVKRLIKRGLVESCSRGKWRLTPAGVKAARTLNPEIKPPSKREVAADIAFREAVHSVVPRRRQRPRRPKASAEKSPQAPARVAGEAGVEIDFDY